MKGVISKSDFLRFPPTLHLIVYLFIILLLGMVAVPNFLPPHVITSDLSYTLNISVQDAQSGAPVVGAKVLVWFEDEPKWRISPQRKDRTSATTDQNGTCEVITYFRLTGSGKIGKVRLSGGDRKEPLTLHVNKTVYIRAPGYALWEKQCAAVLGEKIVPLERARRHATIQVALTPLPVTGASNPPR